METRKSRAVLRQKSLKRSELRKLSVAGQTRPPVKCSFILHTRGLEMESFAPSNVSWVGTEIHGMCYLQNALFLLFLDRGA